MKYLYLLIAFAPLIGSLIAGLLGWAIGRRASHWVTILAVAVSTVLSLWVLYVFLTGQAEVFNEPVYTWLTVGGYTFSVGFLVDALTAMMLVVVTFISLMVHIYTVGYMQDDPGYQRFFSYISLFTFSMLMLVMSNNFVQLFFGWEAVGLVSYLLIGFWFKKPSAIFASLKAFLVNRVGDFGFLLGVGLILAYFGGSLDYHSVFSAAPALAQKTIHILPGVEWSLLSVICILLFIGAMGKSAQFPLHVWLPDSMEGPTPISALIHAATMVTAGIFMVARMSPLFELSNTALNIVMISGAITAFFMGLLGIVQNDIKRVVAYSTLSQLGYMTVALGASAYSLAMFHVMTHAFFKALLFLAAGSVIMGMHHDQDMRHMGGLRKYMPITWLTALVGTLALIGTPLFSGFYSKDSIIEVVSFSNLSAARFAYFSLMAGIFLTALYAFRMYFLVFHGKERWREHKAASHNQHDHHGLGPHDSPHESAWVVTLPLILLAIPSGIIGYFTVELFLSVDGGLLKNAVFVNSTLHPALQKFVLEVHSDVITAHNGALAMAIQALTTLPFWLTIAGVSVAWVCYMQATQVPAKLQSMFALVYCLLNNKYYLDDLYYNVFVKGMRALGTFLWKVGDILLIDGLIVNGIARLVSVVAGKARRLQTGFIYSYATTMIIGVLVLMTLWCWQLFWR